MANGRASMRNIFEFFRLHWDLKLSQEKAAIGAGISKGTAWNLLKKAKHLGFDSWANIKHQSPEELEDLLYGRAQPLTTKIQPDWKKLIYDLRLKHVTRELLWEEYRSEFGSSETMQFSHFCACLAQQLKKSDLAMRQNHIPGEKVFFDFAGSSILISPIAAPSFHARIFVAALGASSLTFIKAFLNETRKSWLEGQIAALEYFGGVPKLFVPDNPKALVIQADRYEPNIAREYLDLAAHYGAAVCPARVSKPKDKARVEAAVGLASRWIIAALRHQQFTSLESLNFRIAELLEKINNKPFRKLQGSRASVFKQIEQAELAPLPECRFEPGDWQYQQVGADYTVELFETRYSIPFEFRNTRVRLRWTETTLEIYSGEKRIALHVRQDKVRTPILVKEHLHPQHRAYAEWGPEEAREKAAEIGPETRKLADAIISARPHPAIALRAVSGLLKLASRHESSLMEKTATDCLRMKITVIKEVGAVLAANKHKEIKQANQRYSNPATMEAHENIRGPGGYLIH